MVSNLSPMCQIEQCYANGCSPLGKPTNISMFDKNKNPLLLVDNGVLNLPVCCKTLIVLSHGDTRS